MIFAINDAQFHDQFENHKFLREAYFRNQLKYKKKKNLKEINVSASFLSTNKFNYQIFSDWLDENQNSPSKITVTQRQTGSYCETHT